MTAEVVERFRHPGVDVEALGDRSQRILQLLDVRERPLSVALVDDAEIRALNLRWRGQDRPTDVLSFGQGEPEGGPIAGAPPPPLGDVIISVERAEVQARERDASLGGVGYALLDELTFLALHGVLHLLGHDTNALYDGSWTEWGSRSDTPVEG